jgi:hypothetical protein
MGRERAGFSELGLGFAIGISRCDHWRKRVNELWSDSPAAAVAPPKSRDDGSGATLPVSFRRY